MADISVNEYVRANGCIAKVEHIEDDFIMCDGVIGYSYGEEEWSLHDLDRITKHSFNIIDLIEVRRLC